MIEVPGQRLRALLKVKRPTAPTQLWREGELSVRRGTKLHGGRFAAAAGVPVWYDDAGGVFADRVTLIVDERGTVHDTLASHVPPIERPALAAARSEASA